MSTYTPIASQTLGSAASSVTFSSIPQGYTDLVIVCSVKGDAATGTIQVRLNGDTGNNYSYTRIYGTGSAAASDRSNNTSSMQLEDPGGGFNYQYIVARGFINNYSNSTTYKTMLGRGDEVANVTMATSNLWRNTNPVTSVTIFTPSNNFASGSTFSLYGIQVGQAAQKAQGGNIVTSDGTYMYHAFTSSGSFIPSQGLTADVLVVAGGGAGAGIYQGGGGGAGGYRLLTSQSLTAKSYPVIVGAGGTGYSTPGASGGNGSNSIFNTITSTGGGGGASNPGSGGTAGNSGGSGGGGTYLNTAGGAGNAGGYTPVEGYAGGASSATSGGGGGGGASAIGGTPSGSGSSSRGGVGGAGSNSASTWASATNTGVSGYYAGGGAGSSYDGNGVSNGGAGGGGNGGAGPATVINPTPGVANTGGGGGGNERAGTNTGANGGSGIVIIRYAI